MGMVITINNKNEAMLIHSEPLGFRPYWVEYSKGSGIRIVSQEGEEYTTSVQVKPEANGLLKGLSRILVVQVQDGKPVEGFQVSFISQDYE